jgi:hypothetical protein
MWYALVAVCVASSTPCTIESAIWAQQSAPIFDSAEDCRDGVLEFLHKTEIPALKQDTQYDIEVDCTQTDQRG